jgi:hypothetical protein
MSVEELSRRRVGAAASSRAGPVIVLSYAGSGAGHLRSVLAGFPELACTAATGILPLCHNAVATWQAVDGHGGGGLSPLAAASARALGAALMTAILARQGGSRWCEFAAAPPAAAETFLRLYPQTRFLLVHRRAEAVVRAVIDASRWGLEGPEFAPFVSASPASTVAALASYWAAHTARQLEFQDAHPAACLRIRTEDLTADTPQLRSDIGGFLALDARAPAPWLADDPDRHGPPGPDPAAAGLPAGQIPAALLAQLGQLHARLGYPPVTTTGTQQHESE